jgi:hypothetical protein
VDPRVTFFAATGHNEQTVPLMVVRMPFTFRLFIVFFLLSVPALCQAELIGWPGEGTIDIGNITNDGGGGRQIVMRPAEPEDVGRTWKFFADEFFEPTPATPAQQEFYLREHLPLILAIPQLAHFPFGASIDVSYSMNGNNITVDAAMHFLGYTTATIYGPHEYLLPISGLDEGEYRLALNLTHSSVYSDQTSETTGFIEFVVHQVPEPSSFVCWAGVALLLAISRVSIERKRLTSRCS